MDITLLIPNRSWWDYEGHFQLALTGYTLNIRMIDKEMTELWHLKVCRVSYSSVSCIRDQRVWRPYAEQHMFNIDVPSSVFYFNLYSNPITLSADASAQGFPSWFVSGDRCLEQVGRAVGQLQEGNHVFTSLPNHIHLPDDIQLFPNGHSGQSKSLPYIFLLFLTYFSTRGHGKLCLSG